MRRTFTTITALGAVLALAACNGDSADDTATDEDTAAVETTDETTETTDADTGTATADGEATTAGTDGDGATGGGMTDPVCAEFFETQGTPLSERATEQFEIVGAGDDLDPVSFSQVNLLNGRIADLVEEAEGEQADLLNRINAPFDEVVEAVTSEDAGNQPEIAIPDVDTADAQAALEEFEASCA